MAIPYACMYAHAYARYVRKKAVHETKQALCRMSEVQSTFSSGRTLNSSHDPKRSRRLACSAAAGSVRTIKRRPSAGNLCSKKSKGTSDTQTDIYISNQHIWNKRQFN